MNFIAILSVVLLSVLFQLSQANTAIKVIVYALNIGPLRIQLTVSLSIA